MEECPALMEDPYRLRMLFVTKIQIVKCLKNVLDTDGWLEIWKMYRRKGSIIRIGERCRRNDAKTWRTTLCDMWEDHENSFTGPLHCLHAEGYAWDTPCSAIIDENTEFSSARRFEGVSNSRTDPSPRTRILHTIDEFLRSSVGVTEGYSLSNTRRWMLLMAPP